MKKILVITTGGTIAMKKDRETGGLMPAVSGKDLAAAVPELAHYADLDVLEFSNKPSGIWRLYRKGGYRVFGRPYLCSLGCD